MIDSLPPSAPASARPLPSPASSGSVASLPSLEAGSWLQAGATLTRQVVRDDTFLQATNIPSSWQPDIAAQHTAHFYAPRGIAHGSPLALLMVFGPLGSNAAALPAYVPLADARNLLVVAVDDSLSSDNSDGRSHEDYYCALKIWSDLHGDGTLAASASFLLAGFSGGAKMAMAVGEYGGTDTFRGVIAAGCNEDLASYALQLLANPSALGLRYVLVNATDDGIVGGATPAVLASMTQSGFTKVSSVTYTGGHVIPPIATLEKALDIILATP